MTINAHRSRLIWSPLIGWMLLSCGMSVAHAQSATQSDVDPSTTTPSLPPGGAAPPILTPGGTVGTQAPSPGAPRPAGTTTTEPAMAAPTSPSAGTTIVNSPFGSSVPYYGGVIGFGPTATSGGVGQAPDETGVGLGAFTLYPQIDTSVGFDNNVFAQNNAVGRSGSPYTTISPSFDLRSDWLNHALHVIGSATFGWYASAPTQNFQNYALIVDGRVDVHHDIYLTGLIGFRRTTEALGTPNVAFAQAPTVVDIVPAEIGLHQEFNDVFYEIGAKAARYWYYDYSVITSVGLPAQSRDRFEYSESLKVGYHVNEDLDIFVRPSLQQIHYIETVNSAGQQRDSAGMSIGAGATWRVNAISILEGEIGLQNRNDPTQGATSALSYALKGTWTGYAPLTLRPTILRSIQESALSDYRNYISTTYAVDANYQIHDEWTLAGGLMLQTADYTPATGSNVGPRTDTLLRGQIGLLYSIKPEVQIGPFFEYSRGTSTDPSGPNYDRQIFSIRLIAKR